MPESNAILAIELNGEPYAVGTEISLTALVERLKLKPGRVAVELNSAVIPKAEWSSTILKAGDTVEIVNFVGGG